MADNRYVFRPYRKFAYPQDMGYPESHIPIDYSINRDKKTKTRLARTYGVNDMDFNTIYWFHNYIPPTPQEMWSYNAVLHADYEKYDRPQSQYRPINQKRLMPARR
jgi:hypothetical protein